LDHAAFGIFDFRQREMAEVFDHQGGKGLIAPFWELARD
jgi:hypothetical protein